MIDLDSILTFEVNTKSLTIQNSNKKEIVGMSFDTFFNENLQEKFIGEIVEKFDYKYLESLVLSNTEESQIFHIKNSPIYYHFISTPIKKDTSFCIFEKRFLSDTLNVSNNLDYLSGVYSRAYMISCIQDSILDIDTKDFYFFIIDLNNFKKINDKLGHRVGDEALRKFAQILLKIRGNNIFGRYGGDEFIMFCPNISRDEAVELVKKILNISFTIDEEDTKFQVTCCLGLTYSNDKNSTFDFLLERADKALYRAKEKGKHLAYLDDELVAKSSKSKINNSTSKVLNAEKNSILFTQESKMRKIKYFSLIAGIIMLCVVFSIFLGSSIRDVIEEDSKKETKNTVSIVSKQIEDKLKNNIDDWIINLNLIGKGLTSQDYNNSTFNYGDFLKEYKNEVVFSDLAIVTYIDNDKKIILSNNKELSIQSESVFNDLLQANNDTDKKIKYVLNYGKYTDEDNNQIIIAVPFYPSEEIVGICGIINKEKFDVFLSVDVFENESVVSLVDKTGLLYGTSRNNSKDVENFLTFVEELNGSESIEAITVKAALISGKSNIFSMIIDDEEKYVYINNIAFNDNQSNENEFRLVFTVPVDKVMSTIIRTVDNIYLIVIVVLTLCMLIVVFVIILNYRHKSKYFVLSNIDTKTKGLNFTRFKKDTQTLINSGERFSYVYVNCLNYTMIFQNEDEKRDELLAYINSIIDGFLQEKELVARLYIDRFIFTVLNNSEHRNRIEKIIKAINDGVYKKYNENIKAIAGVYENRLIDNSNLDYCIDMARLAFEKAIALNKENAVVYYNDRMLMTSIKNQAMKNKAKVALSKGEFVLYYQAQRDIINDCWYSSEALVRWKDPIEGLIFPDAFIPLFEKEGLICELDLYVFDKLCEFIQNSINNNKRVLPVSVNISGKHLEKNNFLDDYYKVLTKYSFDHRLILFELTETVMVENKEQIKKMLDEIHKMGCGCAIDDFGVGYSSFSLITKFDFDEIKLDRSFFNFENEIDEKGKMVISSIIKLCKKLKVRVVAEGVEKASNVAYLKKIGCDVVQGYYFSKPIPQNEYEKLISSDTFEQTSSQD